MIEPLSQRTSPYSENAELGSDGLPMAPPPLPPRSGLRSLRVLPSPEAPQESDGGASTLPVTGALYLHSELEAARNELNALQDMLEELPAILERKFQQRLRGMLEQQRVLIARNQSLRERLLALAPTPEPISLPESVASAGLAVGFRRSLQKVLGRAGSI
jgi:hypothetical protein